MHKTFGYAAAMPDMLVKLYELPPTPAVDGVTIRPARAFEISATRDFIRQHFDVRWADEATAGFAHMPATTLLATIKTGEHAMIVGFACFDCTTRGFFGPTGVDPAHRNRGIGRALLLETLDAMHRAGYAYAIIGGAGPTKFYEDACGAVAIEGSEPGIYTDMLSSED